MILNIITLVFIIIKSTKCSIVHDLVNQDMNYLSKYCPKQKYCREGTHVVCMYYHHNQEYGPRCENPIHVEFTPTMIQQLLAKVNDIRGRVALGMETGKDGEFLPRAFGLMKLEWDRELAIFAQVLANQCLGEKEDICRATNRFPNPSQTIFLIRYKYPDWDYTRRSSNYTRNGLNEENLIFALGKLLKSTHGLKRSVTRDIITSCPYFYGLPDVRLKYYLNLIRGGATHIGCGVSAYSDRNMYSENRSILNRVQIVCNISEAPRPSQPVYKIVPPIPGRGYSKRCGCPRGYKETRNCLCERDKKLWKGYSYVAKATENNFRTSHNKRNEKVKLRSSLWPRRKHQRNQLAEHLEYESSRNVENDEHYDKVMAPEKSQLPPILRSPETIDSQINKIELPRVFSKYVVSKSKTKQDENIMQSIQYTNELSKIKNAITPKKKLKPSKLTIERTMFDDETRKNPRNTISLPAKSVKSIGDLIFKVRSYDKNEATTESTLDVVEESIVDNYQYLKQNSDNSNEKLVQREGENKYPEFSQNRLLLILNSLEQEVNKIKFDEDLKQIFYTKMRKIYETGLKKPEETPSLDALAEQLNVYKKDLDEFKVYLEQKNDANVDDELTHREKMIHDLPKETKTEYNGAYVENKNKQNQNNNYMDHDEYLEIKHFNNMANSYVPSKTVFAERRDYSNIKHKDSLNDKPDIERQHEGEANPAREEYDNDMIQSIIKGAFPPETIIAKPIEYNGLDNYDDEKVDLGQNTINEKRNNKINVNNGIRRRLDKHKDVNSFGKSTSAHRDLDPQLHHSYNRVKQYKARRMKIDPLQHSRHSSESEVMI